MQDSCVSFRKTERGIKGDVFSNVRKGRRRLAILDQDEDSVILRECNEIFPVT